MANSVITHTYRSPWTSWFHFLILVFVIAIFGYGGLVGAELWYKQQAKDLNETITLQNEKIAEQGDENAYQKLKSAQEILQRNEHLKRSEHIPTLITMLEELQETDHLGSDAIMLSDFKVGLDEISLRGEVTNLILLYRDSPKHNYVSLLNRFEALDFIEKLTIQEYQSEDNNNIEFVLIATVKNDK